MTSDKPLVSIGMPVYNGEKYIRQALDSLLAQDYEHFELIISDNASTDETAEICREYAARDARITYHRQPENMGAGWNFDYVFRHSSSKFFMWAAHDDRWATNYITQCVLTLERSPNAILCCSRITFIDGTGCRIQKTHRNLDTTECGVFGRVQALMLQRGWFAIYGLIRVDALKMVKTYRTEWGADVLLLLELLFLGECICTQNTIFYYRLLGKSARDHMESINPRALSNPLLTPYSDLLWNILKAVGQVNRGFATKTLLRLYVLYLGLFRGPDLPSYIRKENYAAMRIHYRARNRWGLITTAPMAILLNPNIGMLYDMLRGLTRMLTQQLHHSMKHWNP